MDKQFIHIDDLVRSKLGNAEEKERPGAWLRMRDLLDKEMPSAVPVGFSWKHVYSLAAGLLLLASAGGGYAVYHSYQQDALNYPVAETTILNTSSTHSIASAKRPEKANETLAADGINQPDEKEGNNSVSIATSASRKNQTTASVASTKNNTAITNSEAQKENMVAAENENLITENQSAQTIAGNAKTNSRTLNRTASTQKKQPLLVASKPDNLPVTIAAQNNLQPLQAAVALPSAEITSSNNAAINVEATSSPKENFRKENIVASSASSNKAVAANANNETAGTSKNPDNQNSNKIITASGASSNPAKKANSKLAMEIDSQRFTLMHDTFKGIEMVHRFLIDPLTHTATILTDTIAIERVIQDYWMLNSSADPAIAAAKRKGMDVSNEMVNLSNLKVKSRKTGGSNARSLNDIVRDAKYNMSMIRFYPGLIGGVNTSLFGANGLTGFQLGLTSLFTFGDKWSAGAELKYYQRFNGNGISDNYYQFDSTIVGGVPNYSRRSVEHNFKFSNMQSLELPVSVRYAWNRLNVFTGINVVYNFRINAEQFDRTYDSTSIGLTPQYNKTNNQPTVTIKDFDARFTAGYLFGVGYQFTPAISLDIRVTQNVWNPVKGEGAQRIYDELYKKPSFQINFGYRFSNNPRFPKAR